MWIYDPRLSNIFGYQERVQAGYFSVSSAYRKLICQAGLRVENTSSTAREFMERDDTLQQGVKTLGIRSEYNRDYTDLFPSAHLSYPVAKDQQMQLSYSRRINRPQLAQLNPYLDVADPLNTRSGNPYLKPELANALELSHQRSWQKHSFTTTAFFRETTGVISRIRTLQADGVTHTIYANAASSTNYGLELAGSATAQAWWRLNGSLSGYRTRTSARNLNATLQNENFTWSGRVQSTMTVWRKLEIQVAGNYRAPAATVQGERLAMYFADVALKKDVLQGKGSVTLRVSDIFNTMNHRYTSFGTDESGNGHAFDTYMNYKRESRIGYLGFTYRLNQETREKPAPRAQAGRRLWRRGRLFLSFFAAPAFTWSVRLCRLPGLYNPSGFLQWHRFRHAGFCAKSGLRRWCRPACACLCRVSPGHRGHR